jgi:hypothetical protein
MVTSLVDAYLFLDMCLFLDTCCLFLDTQSNFHMVVDCANIAMKEHCYWPIVSDLINLLSHKTITKQQVSKNKHISKNK